MRILGIDPGLRVTGFGVIDVDGPRLRYVASGVIRIGTGALPPRLRTIHDGISEVIREYAPQTAVVEIIFVNVNPQSTLLLGQARGAALCALAMAGLPVAEYTPMQIKQAVVGWGKAPKAQVQEMIVRLLELPGTPSKDAADALACATCHLHGGTMLGALAAGADSVPASSALARRGMRVRRGRLVES